MTKIELEQHLLRLGLSIESAAQLLSVASRTVRRWLEGEDVPGPAQQAIRAWIKLHDRHLPWRPDEESIVLNDQRQISLLRAHAVGTNELLERVETRGGPKVSWSVDLDRGSATLGPVHVGFYRLANGSISLANYRRSDDYPDEDRDRDILDDAAYCIFHATKKFNPDFGPVVVFSQDGTAKGRVAKQALQRFDTMRDAMQFVCQNLATPGFFEPFITTDSPTELLWEPRELKRECERRSVAPAALKALAEYVKPNAAMFVRSGPAMLMPAETNRREQRILAVADRIFELGAQAADGRVEYSQFDELLGQLHALGFFPRNDLVSDVARALVQG